MLDLSIAKDPKWRHERERHWQEFQETISDVCTKKQLDVEKRYFMDGEISSFRGYKLNDITLLINFPLKTPDAWAYIMKNSMEGKIKPNDTKTYNTILNSLVGTVTRRMYGWDHEEQNSLFLWLLGNEYTAEITSKVPIGPLKIQPTHKINANMLFSIALHEIRHWLLYAIKDYVPVWVSKLDYIASLIPFVAVEMFDVELHDRSVRDNRGSPVVDEQRQLQYLIYSTKVYASDDTAEEPTELHTKFISDFSKWLQNLNHKPGQLTELIEKLTS